MGQLGRSRRRAARRKASAPNRHALLHASAPNADLLRLRLRPTTRCRARRRRASAGARAARRRPNRRPRPCRDTTSAPNSGPARSTRSSARQAALSSSRDLRGRRSSRSARRRRDRRRRRDCASRSGCGGLERRRRPADSTPGVVEPPKRRGDDVEVEGVGAALVSARRRRCADWPGCRACRGSG